MNQLQVLIVDDSPTASLFLQAKLETAAQDLAELTITRAKSGEEALLAANNQYFDLAILDVVLPGVDGFNVCHTLKEKQQSRVVALLTALHTEDDKKRGGDAGCDVYIIKPINETTLSSVLKLAYIKAQSIGSH